MFDWITKPYIQWTMLDTIIFYIEFGIVMIIIISLICLIIYIKNKFNKRKKKEGK